MILGLYGEHNHTEIENRPKLYEQNSFKISQSGAYRKKPIPRRQQGEELNLTPQGKYLISDLAVRSNREIDDMITGLNDSARQEA